MSDERGRSAHAPAVPERVAELVRLAIPPRARVVLALAGVEGGAAPELDGREATTLGLGQDPTGRLRRLEEEGWEFLVVAPADALAAHLPVDGNGLREVASNDAARVFALHENPPPAGRLAADGLPLPPPELIRLTVGQDSPHRFYQRFVQGGREAARLIAEAAGAAGSPLADAGALLDFGCGCGRVTRNWGALEGTRVCGTDYNPVLVAWCREHLPFGRFDVNGGAPGLPYEDETFDLVYAISVFTHLRADLQLPWMDELRRIVRPGGLLFVTLMGNEREVELGESQRERFAAGELVVVEGERSGTNTCNAYHPARYVRETLARGLDLVEHTPGGADAAARFQDLLLLRRP
jgi:SAM-dependent methyltransferase